jgi:hypothetical protein
MDDNTAMKDENGIPKIEKEYLVTDSCFWSAHAPADYNPFDANRAPHHIELVDVKTGSVVHLQSGSIIRVVKLAEPV